MEKIKQDQFLKFKYISGLQANPSENLMAFLVAKANIKKNDYYYDLYISNGEKHTKTTSLKKSSQFIWETDDTLLFPLTKNKKEEKLQKEKHAIYYRFTLETKKLEKAYTFSFPARILSILAEDKLLLSSNLSSQQHRLYSDNAEQRKQFLENEKKADLYEDIREIPFYHNGSGFTANKRDQIFIYDIKQDQLTPIVDSDFYVDHVKVSKNHQKVYYTGQQMMGIRQLTTHMYCYDVINQKTDSLYLEHEYSISDFYIVEDQIVVAATDMKDYGINQNNDFYILKNKKLILLQKYGASTGNSMGTDVRLGANRKDFVVGDKLYFVSTVDDHTELTSIDLKGLIQPEYIFNGSIEGICFLKDQLVVIGLFRQKLQELYRLDLNLHAQKQISRFNSSALKNTYVATPKEIVINYKTHQVKGWVLYPKDYDSKIKYPAILDIHGGPKTIYGKVYYHEMQYWANEGYVVFFANPRGSDGKKDSFSDIRGKYGTIDYDDLMAFTDMVIKRVPAIDQKRLFVTGGSYGGFMTNWIVGQTQRFKAAVTQRSISNWLSFHGTSDIGFYFSKDQTDGHPNEDTTKLWDQSPMKYALEMKTPLLFIHSDQDYRCPIEQAMQLFTILKEKGVPTQLIWFKGESHELSRSGKPQARMKRLAEITNWFKQYN